MFNRWASRSRLGFPVAAILLTTLIASGCSNAASTSAAPSASAPTAAKPTANANRTIGSLQLTTAAYEQDGTIPDKYTCAGSRVSPALEWRGAPADTAAYVLIEKNLTDFYSMWIVLNLPATTTALPEGYSNSAGAVPQFLPYSLCLVRGVSGTFELTVYALSAPLDASSLDPKTVADLKARIVEDAMAGKILAQGSITATWTNQNSD